MQKDPAGDVTGSLTLTDTKAAVTRFRPAQRRHVIRPGGPGPPFPQSDPLPGCQNQRNPKGRVASADKMVLLTMIARLADGLPLAASMQEDEQLGRDLQQYQSQAKQLFRKLNEQSPTRCTLEAGSMSFHYVLERGVCYLVLCEASFPKKLAFAYLEDLQAEFHEQHGKKVPTVSRPYSFIEFDTYIQKTKKAYIDSRARRNLGSINTELQDVQRIMVANIEEVLQRGEALSALDSKASNLSSLSKKYRSDAKYLNTRSTYAKLAAGGVFFIMLIVYVRFWWL
ncbi:vesicle-trafficking protein SEC22b-B isoform X2 [Hippocampus comes]|uniref:SEC22 homolog B, vesicle trafficking protein b n=2 Tax=Hippocampus TaxID=72046 RepID=A0A3Q2Z5P9_HIPCM|nr:PREDICTED: vesicle-trafficking protein SEC22b-B isoform X2 [Hippocampus comes]